VEPVQIRRGVPVGGGAAGFLVGCGGGFMRGRIRFHLIRRWADLKSQVTTLTSIQLDQVLSFTRLVLGLERGMPKSNNRSTKLLIRIKNREAKRGRGRGRELNTPKITDGFFAIARFSLFRW
jgi:hypothetical protein